MEAIPSIADLAPIGRQGLRCPCRNLLIERVIAQRKQGEHARKADGGKQRQGEGGAKKPL